MKITGSYKGMTFEFAGDVNDFIKLIENIPEEQFVSDGIDYNGKTYEEPKDTINTPLYIPNGTDNPVTCSEK